MRIGIITFTDGRRRVAERGKESTTRFQTKIAEFFRKEGHEVIEGAQAVWNWSTARDEATRMNEGGCDVVVFNYCVWAYPDFTAQAARDVDCPILFVGNINPSYPGWVAFFAAAGALDEIGIPYGRALGDVDEPEVAADIRRFLAMHEPDRIHRGEHAAERLSGLRYGEFDGPSMGMYTGHIDPSQWMEEFGVHVFHRSQLTLAWLAEKIPNDRVEAGLQWLERHAKEILWDNERLPRGVDGQLGRQVRLYLAIKDYCAEEGIDFLGLTGQLDYTEWPHGITMDLPEALLNDTADWENPRKKPIITATECDSNGALTMQLLHHLSGTPVLFADLRHYHKEQGIYDLVNSGQHAPWFATRTDEFAENWSKVRLFPSDPMYFPCGGASVQFYAAPAEKVTFARITRASGTYRMHFFTGSFVDYGWEENERLAKQTSYEWPHAYAKFDCSERDLAMQFSCNHIHAIEGDWLAELEAACRYLGIVPIDMSG
ncbi:MAG: fucose isomerase [Fimbriimonadia bacterium]|jgi:L-fucose isomerase